MLAALLASALGCGGDATEPQPEITPITTAGGTVTSADGKVSLTVPAGALTASTQITITPASVGTHPRLVPGSAYTFEPDGLQFAVPARLTIRYDSVPPSLEDQKAYLWLHRREGSDWVPMQGQPADTLNRSVSGTIDGFSQYGAATSPLAATIVQIGLQLSALLTDGIATTAIGLTNSIAALLQDQSDPSWQALAQPFLQASLLTACTAYNTSLGNARNAPIVDYDEFVALLEPMYSWAAVVELLGGISSCTGVPDTLEGVEAAKFQDFVSFYTARLNASIPSSDFEELVDEVRQIVRLRGNLQTLGLNASDARLVAEAQGPLLDAMRTAAYGACRDLGHHEYLGTLLPETASASYSTQDIWDDLQYCATDIQWEVQSTDGSTQMDGALGSSGTPGARVQLATGPGIANGTITINGDMRPFECPGGTLEADELVVTLQGAEVHRRGPTAGQFFAFPVTLDAATILGMAGIDPTQSAVVPLVVSRESPGCGQYVQSPGAPVALATLNLTYPPPFVYFTDFTGPVPEWSNRQFTYTPSGPGNNPIHGRFLNEATTLTLGSLPAHTEIVIELTFYAIGTMDGSNTVFGPDIVDFRIDNTNVLRTTFSNVLDPAFPQAFPDNYPGGSNPPGSAASGFGSLGYQAPPGQRSDTSYRITFTMPHTASSLTFTISGSGMSDGETWAIDDVRVTAH